MMQPDNDLIRTLNGETLDHVPYFEFWGIPGHVQAHFLGRPPKTWEDWLQVVKIVGMGAISVGGFGWVPHYSSSTASDGTAHYDGRGFSTREEFERFSPPNPSRALAELSDKVKIVHEEGLAAVVYITHCFHAISIAMGLENLAYAVCDYPDDVACYMQTIEDYNASIAPAIIDSGCDLVIYDGDCSFKNAMMVSPATYRKLCFEATRKSISIFKDGDVLPLLPEGAKRLFIAMGRRKNFCQS